MNLAGSYDADVIHWWYITSGKPTPRTSVPVGELIRLYLTEGADERIRGDVAFCQGIKETAWFQYTGTVQPSSNNFCGLGSTVSNLGGLQFPTAQVGVRAHVQHLHAYLVGDKTQLTHPLVDPRYDLVASKTRVSTWEGLGGRWAGSLDYGASIVRLYESMRRGE